MTSFDRLSEHSECKQMYTVTSPQSCSVLVAALPYPYRGLAPILALALLWSCGGLGLVGGMPAPAVKLQVISTFFNMGTTPELLLKRISTSYWCVDAELSNSYR